MHMRMYLQYHSNAFFFWFHLTCLRMLVIVINIQMSIMKKLTTMRYIRTQRDVSTHIFLCIQNVHSKTPGLQSWLPKHKFTVFFFSILFNKNSLWDNISNTRRVTHESHTCNTRVTHSNTIWRSNPSAISRTLSCGRRLNSATQITIYFLQRRYFEVDASEILENL